ncbi:MAG TPA: hypothetical protein DC057_19370 [Spirochaetia bacterium]|nr:hypothetical protein [Spirochaetia bacterium]
MEIQLLKNKNKNGKDELMKRIIICLLLILPLIFIYSDDEEDKTAKEEKDKYYFSVCDQYKLKGYVSSLMWLLSDSNINDFKEYLIAPDEGDREFKVYVIIDDYIIYETRTDSFEEYYFAVKREKGTIYPANSRFDTSYLYNISDTVTFKDNFPTVMDMIVLKRLNKNEFKQITAE